MKTNSILCLLIIGLILTFISCKTLKVKKESDAKPPNFIVILTDDQGWNGTSVQMMDTNIQSKSDFHQTPNLEKLANRGMRFSSAYASAPVCSPSRYSIQFGQTPARLKMIRVGMNTNHINHQSSFTIPKLLKKINSKYKAAHFGKWGIDVDPSELGYDQSDGITGNKEGGFNYQSNKKQWQNNIDQDPKKYLAQHKKLLILLKNKSNQIPHFFYKFLTMQFTLIL
jgi:arylsulfatase A-like enzyme